MPEDSPCAPRAVLWDMDGTLIDSAEYHWLAWQETMRRERYPITHADFMRSFGQRNDIVLCGYFGDDLPASEIDRIAGFKEAEYRRLLRAGGIAFLPGAADWIDRLRAAGWRQAVASSAPRANVETVMEVLGADSLFDALVCGEDVERGKPDPQVFQVAAAALGVPTERCVVVEDAPAGVEAAQRAGMAVIGVLTSHTALTTDLVVASLADLPPGAFDALLAQRLA